jgi:beta-barrel assembly-enhancing protease
MLGRLVVVAVIAAACATPVPPIGVDARPFVPDADERALWTRAEGEAMAILQRVRRHDDPAVTEYLAQLAARLTPEGARAAGGPALRVSVLRDPTLNAFALPDGRLFVHTGLLAAVESEAQLALILAREAAHVVRRHALVVARAGEAEPVPYTGADVLSATAAAILGSRAPVARLAAITGYGDRAELEADRDALAALASGGWDVTHATAVYEALGGDPVGRGAVETFLLGTPTRLQARDDALRDLAASLAPPAGGLVTSEAFEAHRVNVSRENAVEDAGLGRFALARRQLDRVLAAAPADPTAHVYLGDLHRLQAQRAASVPERDAEIEAAQWSYARALALDPARADVHRQLGLLYYQQRDTVRARAELEEYLRRAPGASDAARVAEYVRELAR